MDIEGKTEVKRMIGKILTSLVTGQRTKDQTHLLQGQGLQKAYPTQSHPIQGRKGGSQTRWKTDSHN